MTAELSTYMNISKKNEKQTISKVLNLLKVFAKEGLNGAQIKSVRLKEDKKQSTEMYLEHFGKEASEEELNDFINSLNKDLLIDAEGPYGRYDTLLNSNIFQKIADIDSNLIFNAEMKGFVYGYETSLKAEMRDGLMHLIEYFQSDDDYDEYINFITWILNFPIFCKLFEIKEEDYSDDDYIQFLPDYLESGSDMSLEEFTEYFETSISMKKYNKITKLLDMISYDNYFDYFNDECNLKAGFRYYIYNPKTMILAEDIEQKKRSIEIKKRNTESAKEEFNNKLEELMSEIGCHLTEKELINNQKEDNLYWSKYSDLFSEIESNDTPKTIINYKDNLPINGINEDNVDKVFYTLTENQKKDRDIILKVIIASPAYYKEINKDFLKDKEIAYNIIKGCVYFWDDICRINNDLENDKFLFSIYEKLLKIENDSQKEYGRIFELKLPKKDEEINIQIIGEKFEKEYNEYINKLEKSKEFKEWLKH